MRQILLLLLLFVGFSFGLKAQQDAKIVISGVLDGPLTGGTPKMVELYVRQDIADLSLFGVGSANNGGGSDGEEFTFPEVAATSGSYIYVSSESTEFTNFFGFAPDYTAGAANINGDDAIELFENGAVIDLFGDINTDGTGEPWDHLDGWAYRINIATPTTGAFNLSEWSFSGTNALDGETSNSTAETPFPIGTLPVELTSFEVRTANKENILIWKTSSELDNNHFSIERSTNGKNFSSIGKVEGNGTTNRLMSYSFADEHPNTGVNFYRLKQVDHDGQFAYSSIIQAFNTTGNIRIFPTVTEAFVQVEVSQDATIQVVDITGKPVINMMIQAGVNQIDFSQLTAGQYMIQVIQGNQVSTSPIIKQ